MTELTPELEIMLELLRGWGYDVYQTEIGKALSEQKHPAIQLQLKPKGLYFIVWATERDYLKLRLLFWDADHVFEGDEGFDEVFDQLTIGALKAAIKAAEDICRAWLMLLKAGRPSRELHLGSVFFSGKTGSHVGSDIAKWLRRYVAEKLADIIDHPSQSES